MVQNIQVVELAFFHTDLHRKPLFLLYQSIWVEEILVILDTMLS